MRCFIAAWPDGATRERVTQLQAATAVPPGARSMQPRNFHLTLAFIGELDEAAAHALAPRAGALPQAGCWTMDTLGWFRSARVVWLGGAVPPALADIAQRARALLDELRIGYDRKAFVPHVTLFRDVRDFAADGTLPSPVAWNTARVALYASARDTAGPVYREVVDA